MARQNNASPTCYLVAPDKLHVKKHEHGILYIISLVEVSDRETKTGQLRPEFFYFSFYRPSRPNFLKIEKK